MESDAKEPPPINTPPIPRRPTMENVGTSKQRFSKSRNGCVTCKARRVKCDETKPTCEQCARRRITCGGYKIDVRWKQAAEPKKQNAPKRNRGSSSSQAERPIFANDTSPTGRQNTSSAGFNDNSSRSDQPRLPYSTGSEEMMNLDFMGSSTNATSMDLPTPHTLNLIFSGLDQDILTSLPPNQQAMHSANASPDTVDSNGNTNVVDYASELWNMDTFWEDYLKPLPTTPIVFEAEASHQRTIPETPREREDEGERIAFLFHQQTCHTLSIDEETDRNPWRNLIWPLAKDHPALYEAIAALTCFCMSKEQPQLRNEGTRHIHRSVQMLAESMQNERIPVDVALATTLALAFAETCNCDSSIGLNHMRAGGVLLQQLLANQANVLLDEEIKARSEFLGRTWTYMDVLARFTCPELSLQGPAPEGFNWEALGDDHSRLDPLMGYSTTFFPIMRRVADLINKVRAREQSRNSPAIISQALELRRSIERWTPPIDLEVIDDPSQNMTDAIQTAEAFRWSTLLMLYQAVPELPNLTSYGELAQKILVYLATIPTSSTTIIVHIFPLLVAGCDAVEEEDRDFVRERWNIMSQRMVTGVVERCLKITEELWRRREEYLLQRGLSFNSTGSRIATNLNEQSALSNDIATFINAETSPGAATTSSGGQSNYRSIRKGNDFPISAAFKRGVDILTRSGSTEYTVRGRLHWLGVVKDWNWNFMLA